MSVTEGQIRGKYHQDTNVPRSNQAISQIHKNIERHTVDTIVSWPNPKQWVIVHTSDLMMKIRQSIYILAIITREMGKLKTYSPTYCVMDNGENMLNLTHTLDKMVNIKVADSLDHYIARTSAPMILTDIFINGICIYFGWIKFLWVWVWLCRIGKFLFYTRKEFNYLCLVNVEEWHRLKIQFMFPVKQLGRKVLRKNFITCRFYVIIMILLYVSSNLISHKWKYQAFKITHTAFNNPYNYICMCVYSFLSKWYGRFFSETLISRAK